METLESTLELNFGDMTLRRVTSNNGAPHKTRWLVEGLILHGGTCMLSGAPKTGKTWLALDLAISVAADNTLFLDKIGVATGSVMIYSPEGPTVELVDRIRQVCVRKNLNMESLDLYLVEKKQLFLDSKVDQETLRASIEKVRPCFVVFDPMAECFQGDENRSDDVKIMSRFLNQIAHEFDTTIMLTHHLTKDGASMRGSGALKAFGDSYLYLEKSNRGKITLTNEQRHGTPSDPITLELVTVDGKTAYEMTGERQEEESPKEDLGLKILNFLKKQTEPITQHDMRMVIKGRSSSYPAHLKELRDSGKIEKIKIGWRLKGNNFGSKPKRKGTKPDGNGTREPEALGLVPSPPIHRHWNQTKAETKPKSLLSGLSSLFRRGKS